ncbi:tetratricopeptide repeat protein [Candidatus Aerophobetes bacterium]|nr:tetratricopeptide repeat protein [Candidatus Aerophobetes bacterium]
MNDKKIGLNDLREMIEKYKDYVINIDRLHQDIVKMLTLRDGMEELLIKLEKKGTNLAAEKSRLESFDVIIKDKAKMVYRNLATFLNPLPYREERKIPLSHWWWYLDELVKERKTRLRKKWLIRGGIAALVILAAYIVMVKVIPGPKPSVIYQGEAERLYKEGKLDEAIEIYKKAFSLDPEDSSILLMLGMIYEDKGMLQMKNHYFEEAGLLFPKRIDFYNSRGMIYLQQGKLDKAALDAEKALEIDTNNAFSHFLQGNIYEAEDKIAEAISEYQIVSDLDQSPQLTAMARFKMGMMMQRAPLQE